MSTGSHRRRGPALTVPVALPRGLASRRRGVTRQSKRRQAFSIVEPSSYSSPVETSEIPCSLSVEVIAASQEQQPIVANLLELYVHDFSAYIDLHLGADGRFGYPALPLYWTEPNHYPFLISANDHWAGFALVRQGSQTSDDRTVWDMAEFFIVRGCRRFGVGTKVAHEIWRKFPGRWEIRVVYRNQRARDFWGEVVSKFLGKPVQSTRFQKNGKDWHLFSFESLNP